MDLQRGIEGLRQPAAVGNGRDHGRHQHGDPRQPPSSPKMAKPKRYPVRIVLDSKLRIPLSATWSRRRQVQDAHIHPSRTNVPTRRAASRPRRRGHPGGGEREPEGIAPGCCDGARKEGDHERPGRRRRRGQQQLAKGRPDRQGGALLRPPAYRREKRGELSLPAKAWTT